MDLSISDSISPDLFSRLSLWWWWWWRWNTFSHQGIWILLVWNQISRVRSEVKATFGFWNIQRALFAGVAMGTMLFVSAMIQGCSSHFHRILWGQRSGWQIVCSFYFICSIYFCSFRLISDKLGIIDCFSEATRRLQTLIFCGFVLWEGAFHLGSIPQHFYCLTCCRGDYFFRVLLCEIHTL